MADQAMWLPQNFFFRVTGNVKKNPIGIGYAALEVRFADDDIVSVKRSLASR